MVWQQKKYSHNSLLDSMYSKARRPKESFPPLPSVFKGLTRSACVNSIYPQINHELIHGYSMVNCGHM